MSSFGVKQNVVEFGVEGMRKRICFCILICRAMLAEKGRNIYFVIGSESGKTIVHFNSEISYKRDIHNLTR